MRELIEYRRLTSKIFDLPGRRYRCQTHIGPVHYRVDPLDAKEPWQDINRNLVSDVAGIRCLSNTYQVQIVEKNLDLGVRALAEFAYRGKKMTIAPVALEYRNAAGAAQTLSTGADVKPVVSGNSVTWPDVFGKGIDFGYTVSHLGFQKVVTIHQTESLPTPKIDSKGLRLCAVLSMAWDSSSNAPAACAGVTAERVSADFSGQEVSLVTAASKEAPLLAWEYWKLHPARAWDAARPPRWPTSGATTWWPSIKPGCGPITPLWWLWGTPRWPRSAPRSRNCSPPGTQPRFPRRARRAGKTPHSP